MKIAYKTKAENRSLVVRLKDIVLTFLLRILVRWKAYRSNVATYKRLKETFTDEEQRKLINEYNCIQSKTSRLSRRERERLEHTVAVLCAKGIVNVNMTS